MNRLEPPGAGLPATERMILRAALGLGSIVVSDRFILNRFAQESDMLYQIADHDNSYDVFQKLLIPRVIGIEDSSRDWSILMILEHLCLANVDIMNAIVALSEGIVPRGEIAVEFYKPRENVDIDVLDRYLEINSRYVETVGQIVEQRGGLSGPLRYAHPWFGMLTAHQWHCLACVHQQVHRRQAKKLIAMLGVT